MTNAISVISAVFLLVLMFGQGLALQCYQCTSASEPDCNDRPDRHLITCPSNATSCRKMEQEIFYEGDYHTRVIRQCAVAEAPIRCVERTGTYRFKVWYCHCKEDKCNSAGSFSISVLFLVLSSVFGFAIRL